MLWAPLAYVFGRDSIGGSIAGRHTALKYFVTQTEKVDARVTLGHYALYRDIAVDIKAGNYDKARCRAGLGASSMFDEVKTCVANKNCGRSVEKEARESAPEVLGQVPLAFGYCSGLLLPGP
jgi:hypothetical protein